MIAIVGHISRIAMVEKLAGIVHADYLTIDDGTLGCEGNHHKAWSWLAANNTNCWSIVLEDDCVPVDDFTDQLEQALTVTPAPIVSLYLGRGRPVQFQRLIGKAVNVAEANDANWITWNVNIHAVALAVRTELLPSLLAWESNLPSDETVTEWARTHHHQVAYTWPSLVDHRDVDTLVRHRWNPHGQHQPGRTAWKTGTRPQWNNSQVTI